MVMEMAPMKIITAYPKNTTGTEGTRLTNFFQGENCMEERKIPATWRASSGGTWNRVKAFLYADSFSKEYTGIPRKKQGDRGEGREKLVDFYQVQERECKKYLTTS